MVELAKRREKGKGEVGREGTGGRIEEVVEVDGDAEDVANKFRHHPIYLLSVGQVINSLCPSTPHLTPPYLNSDHLTPPHQFCLGMLAMLAQLTIVFFNDVHLDFYTLNEGMACAATFTATVRVGPC